MPRWESGHLPVPCPSAPRAAVGLGTMPQGEPVCPHAGLELKLDAQGEHAWVRRHPVNVR